MGKRGPKPKKNPDVRDKDYRNRVKNHLTFEEVQEVLAACETLEERLLIELGITTGIRREDIVGIERRDIDLDKRTIVFYETKKKRYWTVALEPEVIQTLKFYIKSLPKKQDRLFNFTGRTAYNYLQNVLGRTSIKKHLEFHALRRTFMRLSKRLGRDVRQVMDQTGDTARTILQEYEGYTVDELVEMWEVEGILKEAKKKGKRK